MRPALLLLAVLAGCGSDSSSSVDGGPNGDADTTPRPDGAEGPRVIAEGLRCPTAPAIFGDHLYWRERERAGDVVTTRIRRSPLTAFAAQTLYEGPERVSMHVATATHLYFTVAQDAADGRLLRVPLTGGTPEPVLDLRQPIATASDRVITFEYTDTTNLVDVTEPGPPMVLTALGIGTGAIAGDAGSVAYIDAAGGRYETFVVAVPGGQKRSAGTSPARPSMVTLTGSDAYWATTAPSAPSSTICNGTPIVATITGQITDIAAASDGVYGLALAGTTTQAFRVRFSASAAPVIATLPGAPDASAGIAATAGHAYWFEQSDTACSPSAKLVVSE